MITLDTSVWMNSISSSEVGFQSSSDLFSWIVANRAKVVVPTLLRVEMAASLSRSGRAADVVSETIQRFAAFDFVHWVPLDDRISRIASDIAISHRLRGSDCVFAAVALDYRCGLVSLDRDHLTRLSDLLSVESPSQALLRMTPT